MILSKSCIYTVFLSLSRSLILKELKYVVCFDTTDNSCKRVSEETEKISAGSVVYFPPFCVDLKSIRQIVTLSKYDHDVLNICHPVSNRYSAVYESCKDLSEISQSTA